MTLDQIHRTAIHLLRLDPECTLNRVLILAKVGKAGAKGIAFKELVKQTGLAASTVSRQVAYMGQYPARGNKGGLDWMELREDPSDPRRGIVYITRKGTALIADLQALD